jgi:hypothetical protein
MASRRNNRQGRRERKTDVGRTAARPVFGEARRALGVLASYTGMRAECLAIEALRDSPPKWLLETRPATPEEDAAGVDVVAYTDAGEIPIQIKSSRTGKREFLEAHPDCRYPVVVVPRCADPALVRDTLLSALGEYRAHVLTP